MNGMPSRFEWERSMRGASIRPTLRAYLLVLGTYMSADGSDCYPSAQTLAEDLGVKRATIFTLQAEAIAAGWLGVHSKRGQASGAQGRGRTNLFEPLIPSLTQSDGDPTLSVPTQSGADATVSQAARDSTQSGDDGEHSRVGTGDTVGRRPDVTTQDQSLTTQEHSTETGKGWGLAGPICSSPDCTTPVGPGITIHEKCAKEIAMQLQESA